MEDVLEGIVSSMCNHSTTFRVFCNEGNMEVIEYNDKLSRSPCGNHLDT